MHSHHSHSGQFCQHGQDTLEDVINRAIELGFTRYCLTEHIPRLSRAHLYPEELKSNTTLEDLSETFDSFYREAQRLKAKYAGRIELLVGFESEGLNPDYLQFSKKLLTEYKFDMFIGSIHHVDEIPIDYDQALWDAARDHAGGIEELYERYFDQQYSMIEALRPPIIGHFDLIRLFSPDFDLQNSRVWPKARRNIELGVQLGCLFEVNTAALRKGLPEPYPNQTIARVISDLGGHFCLSDDAHSISQVGTNYRKVLPYLKALGRPLKSVDGIELTWDDMDVWSKRYSLS